jgi:hypothetical protein
VTGIAPEIDPYALYRYWDAKDILLYVGISGELAQRDKAHIAASKWMQLSARSAIERHKTLADVKKAERAAIETEHPIFNKIYNNTPEAKERLRAYLTNVGRPDLLPEDKARELPPPAPRGTPDFDEVLALLLDMSLPPNALRIGCLMALGWRVGEIVAELEIPRSTYYGALRQLTARAKARAESQVA